MIIRRWGLTMLFLIIFGHNSISGEIVLTVMGPEPSRQTTLSEDQIRKLPNIGFSTFDPWDNKIRTYKGCSVVALLENLELAGKVNFVEIVAKNDYKTKITLAELNKYQYILSYEMDGKDYSGLGEENKGPLAIAVNMDLVPKADKIKVKNHLVWWVEKIVIK